MAVAAQLSSGDSWASSLPGASTQPLSGSTTPNPGVTPIPGTPGGTPLSLTPSGQTYAQGVDPTPPGGTSSTGYGGLVMGPFGEMVTPAVFAQQTNEIAAIEGPKTAPGADMSSYINSFNQSYNQQMSQIQAGLTASLGQLNVRRQDAANIIAKYPGQVNTDYANVTNVGAPQVSLSGLSPAAQKAAAPDVAGDAGVGAANVAAAKGDTAYQKLGADAAYSGGQATLLGDASSAEAGAASQRDAAVQALALQQGGYQDQYQLNRQTAGNQFTESQIANNSAPSGIPGVTTGQLNQIQATPSYGAGVTSLTTMVNNPKAYTYEAYQQMINGLNQSLGPAGTSVLNTLYPQLFKSTSSEFSTQSQLDDGTGPMAPKPYTTGASGFFGNIGFDIMHPFGIGANPGNESQSPGVSYT